MGQSLNEQDQAKIPSFGPRNRLIKLKLFFSDKTLTESYLSIHEELGGPIENKINVEIKISCKILKFFHDFLYSSYFFKDLVLFKLGREVQPNLFNDGHPSSKVK